MLEARELQLRQRFETIIDEFTATRDLLARIDFGQPKTRGADPADQAADSNEPLQGAVPEDAVKSQQPPDRGQASQVSPAEKAAQDRASRLLGVERTLENTQRAAHETRTVGTAFHSILEEMSNNRIDTPALAGRIRDEIADPLVALADKRLPVLVARLTELQKLIDERVRGAAKVDEAVREADAILLEMQNILDKMIEMATYKELVDRLRKLVEQQEELNKETKQRQIENLKNLIEE
jgi:type I site-specific restriction-modification system R (restriction) subunit